VVTTVPLLQRIEIQADTARVGSFVYLIISSCRQAVGNCSTKPFV